ncbi:Beta-galactosidase (Lactase) [Clarireedia jacksonii]
MTQLVQRDKNNPSVTLWSLENEAFYGQNHKAMLIHYEGDVNAESADMFSYMHPPVNLLIKRAKTVGMSDGSFKKPIVLGEYGHAMGNGPGGAGLQDYQAAF